jgi:hypothetical protein
MRLELSPQQSALLLWALGAAASTAQPLNVIRISHTLAGGFEEVSLEPPVFLGLADIVEAAAVRCWHESPAGFARDLETLSRQLRLRARHAEG